MCLSQNLTTSENLEANYTETLDGLNWAGDSMLSSTLQSSLTNGTVREYCLREDVSSN